MLLNFCLPRAYNLTERKMQNQLLQWGKNNSGDILSAMATVAVFTVWERYQKAGD